MALPTTLTNVTTRKLGSTLNNLWAKTKDTFSPKTHTHSVKINGNTKTIAATDGTAVDLGTYLTGHQTIKQDGVTGATVNRFGTCSTAAGTAAKEVSITTGTFSLESGAIVVVKFTNANTASTPTLKVGTTDAKNIFLNGTQVKTGSNKAVLAGTVIFVYDGTQYHVIGNYDANSTYSGFVCGYCNTDAGTTTKSVTATNYVASTGNTILVRFTQANTAANKLSLTAGGVTGDLYINGKLSSTSNYTLPAGTWPCYHNGTNWYVWTDGTYQFGNLWYSAIKGEHQGTMRYNIHVNNTGSDPKGWCPIIRVTHTSGYGSYESVRVHGILYYGNGNWEQAEDQKLDFQAVLNISSNSGKLLLGKSVLTSDNYIRLIKIADRDYELQYNAAVANCDYDIYYQYEYGGVPESCITRYTTYQAATNTGTAITSGKLYDGSNAWQADQLTTARELAVSLSNTSTTTKFNGTAAVTNIKVSGQLADANIASASTWNAKQSALPTTGTPSTTYAINVSGSAGSAATATTTADTSNTLYVVGVQSGATSTLKHDTSVTVKGNTVTAANFAGNASTATKPKTNQIASTANLNDYKGSNTGDVLWYYWTSTAPTNAPLSGSSAVMQVVKEHSGEYVRQTVYVTGGQIFTRKCKNGTWDTNWADLGEVSYENYALGRMQGTTSSGKYYKLADISGQKSTSTSITSVFLIDILKNGNVTQDMGYLKVRSSCTNESTPTYSFSAEFTRFTNAVSIGDIKVYGNTSTGVASIYAYVSSSTSNDWGHIGARCVLVSDLYQRRSIGQYVTFSNEGVIDASAPSGTAVTVTTNMLVNASDITTGSANGTIAVAGTDVDVKGLGAAAYKGIDTSMSSSSTNPVQNKTVNDAINLRGNRTSNLWGIKVSKALTANWYDNYGVSIMSTYGGAVHRYDIGFRLIAGTSSAPFGSGSYVFITRSGDASNYLRSFEVWYRVVDSTTLEIMVFTGANIKGVVTYDTSFSTSTVTILTSAPSTDGWTQQTSTSIVKVTTLSPDTHYTTHLYAGASGTAANAATTNGNTYLIAADNSTVRNNIKVVGSGTTSVSSDANGVITITSSDSKTGTVTSVATGAGLTGGTITSSGTIKANLKSETAGSIAAADKGSTANREYAVGLDSNSKLSVNIPWENTHYASSTITGASATATANAAVTGTTGVFLNHIENSAVTSSHKIIGSGTTTVKCDANGVITINSADSKTGTVTSVATGVGLTGGSITTSGTIKANLASETASSLTAAAKGETANREYAVGIDANNKLSVNIPWTNTHYASSTITGASATATANAAVTGNAGVFLNHIENSAVKSSHKIVGSGTTTVNCDANGVITISSADSKTGTVTSVATGAGLTGGTITSTGTIKANLKSETASSLTASDKGSTSSREYAVGLDVNSNLSVNIPWTDTKVTQKLISTDGSYPVILKNSTTATDSPTSTVNYGASITANPNNGQLHATTFDVNSKCTIQFNTTTNALDFVFA